MDAAECPLAVEVAVPLEHSRALARLAEDPPHAPRVADPERVGATDIDALANGLSGVRVVSGDPSPSASICVSSPCRLD